MNKLIENIIKPENDIEIAICNNEDFIIGCDYGKPRPGHNEGKVIYHIKEVLSNVDKYCNEANRSDLRLIAMIHDTFKHKVDRTKSKFGENHHGMIARRFAEKLIKNNNILKIIELHDEAYNAWSKGNRKNDINDWTAAIIRANNLIRLLLSDDILDLYLTFYRCDNETGDKTQECYVWFKKQLEYIK